MLKQFMRFVIPSILSMVIFNLYTLVDGIFVAHFVNDLALAGINVATPYITTIFSVGILFAIGSSTLMSIYRGEKNYVAMNKIYTMNILVISCLALAISILSFIFSDDIALALGSNIDIFEYSSLYIRVISCFAFFYIVAYCFEVLLKADGYPHKSMIGVGIGACTNIILDALFLGVFHMGLFGAALATGISQMLTFFYYFSHFVIHRQSHFKFVKGPYPWKEYPTLLSLGMADAISEISPGIMIIAFNYRIDELLSTSGLVSYSIIMYVYNLVLMAMVGISQGIQPLISYYYGKDNQQAIQIIHRYARILVSALSLILFIFIEVFANQIVACYISKETAFFNEAVFALRLFSSVFLLMGHVVITIGYMTALKKPKQAFGLSLGRGIFMIIVSLYVCSYFLGSIGIWISAFISEMIMLFIAIYCLYQYKRSIQ